MTAEQAIEKLAAAHATWRASGSTIQFNKTEGEIFSDFRQSNPDWETSWPAVRQAAYVQEINQ